MEQDKREKVVKSLETAIKNFERYSGDEYGREYDYAMVGVDVLEDAIALLKAQEPKLPKHIHEEYSEHDWQRDEEGNIDMWGFEYGYHNGPTCTRCDYSFCIHCEPDGYNAEPCIVDEYRCPSCGVLIEKKQAFCVNCGQAVKWDA